MTATAPCLACNGARLVGSPPQPCRLCQGTGDDAWVLCAACGESYREGHELEHADGCPLMVEEDEVWALCSRCGDVYPDGEELAHGDLCTAPDDEDDEDEEP